MNRIEVEIADDLHSVLQDMADVTGQPFADIVANCLRMGAEQASARLAAAVESGAPPPGAPVN